MRLRIAISGGSVGGITAALWLMNAGHDVTVFERSPTRLEGRGAGIVLHETTLRYLVDVCGISVESISEGAKFLRYLSTDGEVIFEEPTDSRFTSWNTLYRSLFEFLGENRYCFSRPVIGFEPLSDGVLVHTANHPSEQFDLLVCAEGISSSTRQKLLPNINPTYSGYVGWRGVVAHDLLSTDTRRVLENMIVYAVPPHNQVLSYEIPDIASNGQRGSLFNWVWYRNIPKGTEIQELMKDVDGTSRALSLGPGTVRKETIDELKRSSRLLPPQLAELICATSDPFVQMIVDFEAPRMVFGRVCLIGDAAFTVRPHAAAGSAKAAEDGWSLAVNLSTEASIEASLACWETERLSVGSMVANRSRKMGERSQRSCDWYPEDPELRFGLHGPNN